MADFFNKVKHGIEKGVATASVKSKEALDSARIKSQVRDLQEQRRALLEELGNIAHTMFLRGAFDEARLRAKCEGIGALDDRIKQKEAEDKEIHLKAQEALGKPKPVATCTCGADLHEGTKYCGKCGRAVQANEASGGASG